VLVDTAGRLQIDPDDGRSWWADPRWRQPVRCWLVVDFDDRPRRRRTHRAFHRQVGLPAAVLNQARRRSRGRAPFRSARWRAPISFIGTGEKVRCPAALPPGAMAAGILGMGDVLTWLEKAQQGGGTGDVEKMPEAAGTPLRLLRFSFSRCGMIQTDGLPGWPE